MFWDYPGRRNNNHLFIFFSFKFNTQEAKDERKSHSFSNLVCELSSILHSDIGGSNAVEDIDRRTEKRKKILNAIKVFLVKNRFFSSNEAEILTLMMERSNVYSQWQPMVEAAFEIFKDGNVLELIDTIARIVKIASREKTSSSSSSSSERTCKRVKPCPVAPPDNAPYSSSGLSCKN